VFAACCHRQIGTIPGLAARFPKLVRWFSFLQKGERNLSSYGQGSWRRRSPCGQGNSPSPLSILWICAPEACLLVDFDWPRTGSSIRYSSWLFTAPNVGSGISLQTISRIWLCHARKVPSPAIWRSSCAIPSA